MSDYSFIKEFNKINMSSICEKFNINKGNISSGTSSDENYRKVKNEIIRELLELFLMDKKEDFITLYLYDEIIKKQEKDIKMLKELI